VRLREEIPAIDAQAAGDLNAERARLAEWDADQLRGQIVLVQQDLTWTRNDLTRFKASVAVEREASARSNQQAASLAELSARL